MCNVSLKVEAFLGTFSTLRSCIVIGVLKLLAFIMPLFEILGCWNVFYITYDMTWITASVFQFELPLFSHGYIQGHKSSSLLA